MHPLNMTTPVFVNSLAVILRVKNRYDSKSD